MLYVLFFLFRDGRVLLDRITEAIPLGESLTRKLFARFAEVARGTVKGTVVIGLIQGGLGGIAFAVLGLEAPVLWGSVMVAASVLPAIGPGLVWVPAAIVLFIQGEWVRGLVLVLFGTFVIGLVDNFLRPRIVGNDTKMPDYLVLVSTLGGLALFGVAGFVIGPVIAALFLVVWEIFQRDFEGTQVASALGDARYTAPPDCTAPEV
jgi:predicted PurR-regulated permease PerM